MTTPPPGSQSEAAQALDEIEAALKPVEMFQRGMYWSGDCSGQMPTDWPDKMRLEINGVDGDSAVGLQPISQQIFLSVGHFRALAKALSLLPTLRAALAPLSEEAVAEYAKALEHLTTKGGLSMVGAVAYMEARKEPLVFEEAALAPAADGAGEVEEIRARHEEVQGWRPHKIDWAELDGMYAHADRATLLKEHDRQQYAIQIKNNQIEELEELLSEERARRVEATAYARNLMIALHRKHYPENAGWEVLPDLIGILTQIDNATTGLARATHKDTQDE